MDMYRNRVQDERLLLSFTDVKAAINKAVPVFAAHMRRVTKNKGFTVVSQWYKLDRINDLFIGTESGEEPIDRALKALGAWDIVQNHNLHFIDSEGNRSGIGIENYVEEIMHGEVRSRLIGRFFC